MSESEVLYGVVWGQFLGHGMLGSGYGLVITSQRIAWSGKMSMKNFFAYLPDSIDGGNTEEAENAAGKLMATVVEDSTGAVRVQTAAAGEWLGHGKLLVVRRTDHYTSREEGSEVGIVTRMNDAFTWEPSKPEFDFLALFSSKIGWKDLQTFLLPFGVDTSELEFAAPPLEGKMFFCGGPGVDYTLSLQDYRLFGSDEDVTKLSPVSLG